jgi:hypothetical protein
MQVNDQQLRNNRLYDCIHTQHKNISNKYLLYKYIKNWWHLYSTTNKIYNQKTYNNTNECLVIYLIKHMLKLLCICLYNVLASTKMTSK